MERSGLVATQLYSLSTYVEIYIYVNVTEVERNLIGCTHLLEQVCPPCILLRSWPPWPSWPRWPRWPTPTVSCILAYPCNFVRSHSSSGICSHRSQRRMADAHTVHSVCLHLRHPTSPPTFFSVLLHIPRPFHLHPIPSSLCHDPAKHKTPHTRRDTSLTPSSFSNRTAPFTEPSNPPGYVARRLYVDPTYPSDLPSSIRCGRDNLVHASGTEVLPVRAGDTLEFLSFPFSPQNWSTYTEVPDVQWENCPDGRGGCSVKRPALVSTPLAGL